MENYKDFVFKGGWRQYIEAVAEEISEDLAKELLWNIMIGCTGGEFSSSHPFITGFVNGCCLPFLEPPRLYWKKAASELSKSALLVYLLMQEEGVEIVTPTYVENWGLMKKGTASKAITELKEKGYLVDKNLVYKADKDIHWRLSEKTNRSYLVYRHTFPNQKQYIGITSRTSDERWQRGKGYKHNKEMYQDILKFGWDSIKHEVLYTDLTYEEAREIELKMIADLGANCYNKEGKRVED